MSGVFSQSKTITLFDDGVPFQVSLVESKKPSMRVLFSVGSGGNPDRHESLLSRLIALTNCIQTDHPCCAKLTSSEPEATTLDLPDIRFVQCGQFGFNFFL